MLQTIHVRNFAIIDEVSVDLGDGMNVLTGETGAGKSILIDALGLVLGDRASVDVIRQGAKRAEINASFSVAGNTRASDWLSEQMLDGDDECHVRRVIGSDGRSKGFINGNPAPMQSLRQLGQMLVNIHGQHEHQSLQQPEHQRDMLDARGGLTKQRNAVAKAYASWADADEAVTRLETARAQRDDRLEFLRFQLGELEGLGLQPGEIDELEPERARLANSGRLAEGSAQAVDALYERDADNAQSLLAEAARELTAIAAFDESLQPIITMISEAEVNVSEAADALRRYQADIESDPQRQEQVESRLAAIHALCKKHRITPDALIEHTATLREEFEGLTHADERMDALAAVRDEALGKLRKAADTLSKARRKAATGFSREVTQGMQQLGMPGGQFEAVVTPRETDTPARHGDDRVSFTVSANPGQPLQSVAKVASGGELSRISLAIQAAAGRGDEVPCMIFDEVDSGVGGAVAEIVGQQMRALAGGCQVLAVTHLAQVAGQAHHHYRVTKMSDGKTTRTAIAALSEDARVEEIARMLGGVSITDTSREHAREMLAGNAG